MAIREVEMKCSLSYEEQREFERSTGKKLGWVKVVAPSVSGDLILSMDNEHQEHLALFYVSKDETSHVGRVVAIEVERGVRIMSDVWADLTYAVLYEPTREHTGFSSMEKDYSPGSGPDTLKHKGACGYFRRVCIGNTEFGRSTEIVKVEADACQDIQDIYKTWKRGQAFRKEIDRYDADQYRIQTDRRTPGKGKWVRVTSGRKVPQGTEGIVFWMGDSQWGTKVGIAVPQEDGSFRMENRSARNGKIYQSYKDIVWTYYKNISVISGPGGRLL